LAQVRKARTKKTAVRVNLEFTFSVPYTVKVEDPEDIDEIRGELQKKHAWDYDHPGSPGECIADQYETAAGKVTLDDVEAEEDDD
jgi:hypothetical protein